MQIDTVPIYSDAGEAMKGEKSMEEEHNNFTKIHTLTNQFEADILSEALDQAGIPVLVRPFQETAYAEIFVTQKGWGWLMAPLRWKEKAKDIIQATLKDFEASPHFEATPYSNPWEIDPLLWQELRDADPDIICAYSMASFEPEGACYRIPFFNTHLLCFPQEGAIRVEDSRVHPQPDFEFHLVTLNHLLRTSKIEPTGKWISEKEVPGGEQFFRGMHRFPLDTLLEELDASTELLRSVAQSLGGHPLLMGDAAFSFTPFPRIPIALIMWEGDEEFAPSLQLLLDANVHEHFKALDVIWALANVACRTLGHAARKFHHPSS